MPALPTQPRSSRIRDARHERVRVQKLQTIYLQNRGIDHIKYSISLGLGNSQETAIIHGFGLFVEGVPLKAGPDRQDTTLELQVGLQAATNKSDCDRL